MFLLKVVEALVERRVKFALCGGQALALHGAVRGTLDVDLVLRLDRKNLEEAELTLTQRLGLTSRIPVTAEDIFHFREEYQQKRNLKAWSFVNAERPSEVVDLVITDDLKDMKIVFKEAWGQKIPVISVEDLIRMKKAAGRPQDLADVQALESNKKESP
jgi:hypothetical protein